MRYANIEQGIFLRRPNRFIAHVKLHGRETVVHVKNTGRCRELLPAGAVVYCQKSDNPNRKTQYDLIAVDKAGKCINMDSQAPNQAVLEWLGRGGLGQLEELKAETVHGDSRFDFSFRKDGKRCFLEVKGVTLEANGVCAFPDAPTQRGTKHLKGLIQAVQEGFGGFVLFVLQMEHALSVHPNDATDPAFGKALREAAAAGVQVLAVNCRVTPESMEIQDFVPVNLA